MRAPIASVILALSVMQAGCSAPGSSPPAVAAPSATASPPAETVPTTSAAPATSAQPAEWTYVVFGDSVMWNLQHAYAAEIEEALGVSVKEQDRTSGGGRATKLVEMLEWQFIRDLVAEAEVITIEVPVHEFQDECGMDETTVDGTRACMTRARETIVASADEAIDVITGLRGPDEAMIRVILDHLFFYGIHLEQGTADVAKAEWSAMNEAIAGIAAEHGLTVVSLWDALMGPDGMTDPMAVGLVEDGVHLTPAGIEVAAKALVDAGFADAPGIVTP
jgi:hypothetical protein